VPNPVISRMKEVRESNVPHTAFYNLFHESILPFYGKNSTGLTFFGIQPLFPLIAPVKNLKIEV
jgi:hypothetical protein